MANPKREPPRPAPNTRHNAHSAHSPQGAPRSGGARPMHRPQVGPATSDVELVYGYRACMAVLQTRPHQVRVVFAEAMHREELSKSFASVRVQLSDESALRRMTESKNHEGIVLQTEPRKWASIKELSQLLLSRKGICVAMDRVRNPYNIGAILRSASFFGVDAVLLGAIAPEPALPEDAVRVAEGGAERTVLARTTDLAHSLGALRSAGIAVVGAESDGAQDWAHWTPSFPSVFVVGHEREGLSERVRAQCDSLVCIKGAGTIESLNVSIAASLIIGQLSLRRPRL